MVGIVFDFIKTDQVVVRLTPQLRKARHKPVTEQIHQGKVDPIDTVHVAEIATISTSEVLLSTMSSRK
jgi:hypothetical protein